MNNENLGKNEGNTTFKDGWMESPKNTKKYFSNNYYFKKFLDS